MSGMQIFVKPVAGKTIILDVDSTDFVHDVKSKIEESQGIPWYEQCLTFMGQQLQNDRTLASYRIQKESTLHLMLRMISGPPACGSTLLAHGLTVIPPLLFQHSCDGTDRAQSDDNLQVFQSNGTLPCDQPLQITFDVARLNEFTECLGPHSASYLTQSYPAELIIRQGGEAEEGPIVFREKTAYFANGDAVWGYTCNLPSLTKRYFPTGKKSWLPNTTYNVSFLNEQRRGVLWRFTTSGLAPAAASTAQVDEVKVDGLLAVLRQLDMTEFLPTFEKQQVKLSDLATLQEADYQMLVPEIGPRRRLQQWAASSAAASVKQ